MPASHPPYALLAEPANSTDRPAAVWRPKLCLCAIRLYDACYSLGAVVMRQVGTVPGGLGQDATWRVTSGDEDS